MIENDEEYERTKDWLQDFRDGLAQIEERARNGDDDDWLPYYASAHQVVIDDLTAQIEEYEKSHI